MIETIVDEWGAGRHPQYAVTVEELAPLVWQAVQSNPPRYATVPVIPVKVLLEDFWKAKQSAAYLPTSPNVAYTVIELGIEDVRPQSPKFRYIVAHELAHAYAPSAKMVRHITRSGHDNDPVEKYADKIAAMVVTDYSRQDFYKETPEW